MYGSLRTTPSSLLRSRCTYSSWSSSSAPTPYDPPASKTKHFAKKLKYSVYEPISSDTKSSRRQRKEAELVSDLIQKNAEPPSGWKERPRLNAAYNSLSSKIPTLKAKKADSLDRIAFLSQRSSSGENSDNDTSALLLSPGTFIELRRSTVSVNAVVISTSYTARQLTFLSLTHTGEVWTHQADDVLFDIPNFVSKEVAHKCGEGKVAGNSEEHSARVEVLKKLKMFGKETEERARDALGRGIDIYDLVRNRADDRLWGETTVGEVARLLLSPSSNGERTGKPTIAHILAAHKHLITNSLQFVIAHDYNTSRRFRVRPLADVRRIETINRWAHGEEAEEYPDVDDVTRNVEGRRKEKGVERKNQGLNLLSLTSFIEKAQAILQHNVHSKSSLEISRERTSYPSKIEQISVSYDRPLSSTSVSSADASNAFKSSRWTPSDIYILTFLIQSLRPRYNYQPDPFINGIQYIVKKIIPSSRPDSGPTTVSPDTSNVPSGSAPSSSQQEIFDETVHRLLVDLGALAPWQDLVELREDIAELLEGSRDNTVLTGNWQDGLTWDDVVKKGWEEREKSRAEAKETKVKAKSTETTVTSTPRRHAPTYTPSGTILSPSSSDPYSFYPVDPCAPIRHDFGDIPVYVIDDKEAKELDDGVSFEVPADAEWMDLPGHTNASSSPYNPSGDSSYDPSGISSSSSTSGLTKVPSKIWIHVHIADPTSLLPPTHALCTQRAEKMATSVYFTHKTYGMLPKSLTHGENGFSLGSRLTTGKEEAQTSPLSPLGKDQVEQDNNGYGAAQPTLTFSVLLSTSNGDLLDYAVRPSLVRNVIVTNYEAVDEVLGIAKDRWLYPFGGKPASDQPPTHSTSPFTLQDRQNLQMLNHAAQVLVRRRFDDGVFTLSRYDAKLVGGEDLFETAGIPWERGLNGGIGQGSFGDDGTFPLLSQTGFPFPLSSSSSTLSVPYRVYPSSQIDLGSRSLVAETMKLASRACSLFFLDRKIPITRRVASAPVVESEEKLKEILKRRTAHGYVEEGSYGDGLVGDNGVGKYIVAESAASYVVSDGSTSINIGGGGYNPYSPDSSFIRGFNQSIVPHQRYQTQSSTQDFAHWGLGIPSSEGYVRCTSPLRRFADLIAHWQLKHALLGEYYSSRKSDASGAALPPSMIGVNVPYSGSSSAIQPLFTLPYLSQFALRSKAQERFMRRVQGQHEAWWNFAWIIKWLERNEAGKWSSAGENVCKHEGSPSRPIWEFTSTSAANVAVDNASYHGNTASYSALSGDPNPFIRLLAHTTSTPELNRDSRKYQVPVSIPSLGIKAVLSDIIGDSASILRHRHGDDGTGRGVGGGAGIGGLEVGDVVEIEVRAMRLGARPQMQVVLKR